MMGMWSRDNKNRSLPTNDEITFFEVQVNLKKYICYQ